MRLIRAALLSSLLWTAAAGAQPVPPLALTAEQLDTLPQHQVTLTFGNPPAPHGFSGPLVWEVLTASGTVDPARHMDAVRQVLKLTGADGYTALVALGEISPEFENKGAVLASRMDGAPLPVPRMIVTGDKRAGRSVRDVVALSVETLPQAPPVNAR